jgi:hypothetical protein
LSPATANSITESCEGRKNLAVVRWTAPRGRIGPIDQAATVRPDRIRWIDQGPAQPVSRSSARWASARWASARRVDRSGGSPRPVQRSTRVRAATCSVSVTICRAADPLPQPRREIRIQPDRSAAVRVEGAVPHIQKSLRRQAFDQHRIVLRHIDVPAARYAGGFI